MNINPEPRKDMKKRTKEKKKPRKITESYLHNSGLYYLQRYASSVENFKTVMKRKAKKSCMAHPEQDYETCVDMVDKVALKFIDLGLLNDTMYLESMINSLRRQGKSKNVIRMKLIQKGLRSDDILSALEKRDQQSHEDTREAEYAAALTMARKKRLGPFDQTRGKPQDKAIASMARAGFSYDIIKSILDLDPEEAETKLYEFRL